MSASFNEDNYPKWNTWFQSIINDEGLVNYQKIEEEKKMFEEVELFFEKTPLDSADENQRLAFYMNAYNIKCMRLTLDQIRHGNFKGYLSFWAKFKTFFWAGIHVAGKSSTLYKLENDIIRGKFSEPRIHMCINCASWSCPRLSHKNLLFSGATLEEQMEERTKDFIANQGGVLIKDESTLEISEIFKWYKEDFDKKGHKLGVVSFIAQYHPQVVAEKSYKLTYSPYDWHLNAVKQ